MSDRPFETVSIVDPAIDHVATSLDAMRRFVFELRTPDVLTFKSDGPRPMRFFLRDIPNRVWDGYVSAQESDELQFSAAFRAALVGVHDGMDRDGQPMQTPWVPQVIRDKKRNLLAVDSLLTDEEFAIFAPVDYRQVGRTAWSRSGFFHRGTVLEWQPLGFLLPILDRLRGQASRTAELTKTLPTGGETAPSLPAAAEESSAPKSADASGSAGPATATASPI